MSPATYSHADRAQMAALGVPVEEVERQRNLFERPPPPIQLVRPCILGDGIQALASADERAAVAAHSEACAAGRLLKFVPASGAASRMFQSLMAYAGGEVTGEVLLFRSRIREFAFFDELVAAMRRGGIAVDAVDRVPIDQWIEHLLSAKGLAYAEQPKGLLAFHRYTDHCRTAFEEHLAEAIAYVRDRDGGCRLHFTVSPQHEAGFRALLARVETALEHDHHVRFDVGFSHQKAATDTVAVDEANQPFRTADGRLLFRPAGHGALIENLNDLRGDIVYIKNIDNVVPDHLRSDTIAWKQRLAGHLVLLQQQTFAHLRRLDEEPDSAAAVDGASAFATATLGLTVPGIAGAAERRRAIQHLLDRPLRVCGMVRNTGEPGGGPFWVSGRDGAVSRQIVESAQVDPDSSAQAAVFRSATHFNPVDLVCGVRDWRGAQFDLTRYVDRDAVFIAQKSQDGRRLQALELPGMWNGAMADWITIFVEVPVSTFNPVKTVTDLLRPQHQAA